MSDFFLLFLIILGCIVGLFIIAGLCGLFRCNNNNNTNNNTNNN